MSSNHVKKRYWAFCAYPESLPDDWLDFLSKTGLPIVVSPLHDKDVNPTGELKKPHFHVILCYSGPTSFSVVKKLTDSLGQPIPQPLESVKGYYRYLTHMDNPEKAQYDSAGIVTLNGFNIADYAELTRSEVLAVKRELQEFIRDNGIFEYSDFMDFILDSKNSLHYDIASNNTFFFEKYISSRRNKFKLVKDDKTG